MDSTMFASNGLRLGKVCRIVPEAGSVDVVLYDNGARVQRVQVLGLGASTNTGTVDLPDPTPPDPPWDLKETRERDILAVIAYMGDLPICLGFLHPQVNQMHFERHNFRVSRHASDVYVTTDAEGNVEISHPSGTYIRIAEDPAHEDLTGLDYDGRWKIAENTERAPHIRVRLANAGDQVVLVDMTPDGDVSLEHTGDLDVQTGGDATIAVTGSITSSAAAWNHTGPVNITGEVTVDGDVTADGVSLKTHTHSGVDAGAGDSGPPNA